MSTGAVFKLSANDGKVDRMLLGTAMLYQRIAAIIQQRTIAGKADITPTLADLEKTHVLWTNAHFKPQVATGWEYNKTTPQSGTSALGQMIQFSIPQFGDFFADMVVQTSLGSVYANVGSTPTQYAGAAGATTIPKVFPCNGQDAYGNAATQFSYNIVDLFGNVIVAGTDHGVGPNTPVTYRNFVQYCEFPGHRLFSNVKFDVNGNPLDEYITDAAVMLDKFTVLPHKRTGNNRLVGQQVPIEGVAGVQLSTAFDADNSGLPQWSQISLSSTGGAAPATTAVLPYAVSTTQYLTGAGILRGAGSSAGTQSNQTVALYQAPTAGTTTSSQFYGSTTVNSFVKQATTPVAPVNTKLNLISTVTPVANDAHGNFLNNAQVDFATPLKQFLNGPQTPKPIQPPLDIWNKLKFWFCDDVRLAIPSVSIPFGQRFISVTLTTAANLVFESPSIYLETIQTTAAAAATTSSATIRTYTPIYQYNGLAADPAVNNIQLYINNIFVNPEIHDIFIKRIGFALIRVYRYQRSTVNTSNQETLLSGLKWPVEYMFVGFQPAFNTRPPLASSIPGFINAGNVNIWRDWHRMTRQLEVTTSTPMQANMTSDLNATTTVVHAWSSSVGEVNPTKYYIPVSSVDQVSLVSHGIPIFQSFSDLFYSSYIPYNYGGTNLQTPEDTGAIMINFALFPRSYQPSGHLNISRVRETYLTCASQYVNSAAPLTAIIVAICINFLLISDGSAVLRYST